MTFTCRQTLIAIARVAGISACGIVTACFVYIGEAKATDGVDAAHACSQAKSELTERSGSKSGDAKARSQAEDAHAFGSGTKVNVRKKNETHRKLVADLVAYREELPSPTPPSKSVGDKGFDPEKTLDFCQLQAKQCYNWASVELPKIYHSLLPKIGINIQSNIQAPAAPALTERSSRHAIAPTFSSLSTRHRTWLLDDGRLKTVTNK